MDASLWNLLAAGLASFVLSVESRPYPDPAPEDRDARLARLIEAHRSAAYGARVLPVHGATAPAIRPALCRPQRTDLST